MSEVTQFAMMRKWLLDATRLPDIVLAHQDAPRPSTDYGVLNVLLVEELPGTWCSEYIDEENEENIQEPAHYFQPRVERWVWRFEAVSRYPLDVLRRVPPWQKSDAGQLYVYPNVIHSIAAPVRVPEIVDNHTVARAYVDITMHVVVREPYFDVFTGAVPVDEIDTATIGYNTFATQEVTRGDELGNDIDGIADNELHHADV